MDFKIKYLKYKNKYFKLKNVYEQIGGLTKDELLSAKEGLRKTSARKINPPQPPPSQSVSLPPPPDWMLKGTKPHTVSTPGGSAAASPPPITPRKRKIYYDDTDRPVLEIVNLDKINNRVIFNVYFGYLKSEFIDGEPHMNQKANFIINAHNQIIFSYSQPDNPNEEEYYLNPDLLTGWHISKRHGIPDPAKKINIKLVDAKLVTPLHKSHTVSTPGVSAAASPPHITPRKNIGYDFDGVLHRTMKSYQYIGPGLYQGHPKQGNPKEFELNENIKNDAKRHILAGHNVYIISRNPSDKMGFINKNSRTLGRYFRKNPGNIIVVPPGISKADKINELNITKFVEDSSAELQDIYENTSRDVDLFFVNTWETFTNPFLDSTMVRFVPIKPGGAAAAASPPPITPRKNIGYDFDGVLHRTMKSYQYKGPGLYQGHPDFHKDPSTYQVNENIKNDAKRHIQAGHNVYIISRNPSDKMGFINKNSRTLGRYFRKNPGNIIVVPRKMSKADIIKELNITKFVEDSSSELQNIYENTTGVHLFFVNTWQTYKSNTEPEMMQFIPITPGGAAAVSTVAVPPVAGVAPVSDTINLLSYNVLYKSFTMPEKNKFGTNIVGYINKFKPDIMVLTEASPLVPNSEVGDSKWYSQINLPNYNRNIEYLGSKRSGGTIIYWSDKFKKDISVRDPGLNICEFNIQTGHTKRPCIGVKLIHQVTGKKYIIIGVHYGHRTNPDVVREGINIILDNLKYTNEEIIIMGDHNEFYEIHQLKNFTVNTSNPVDLELKTIDPSTGQPYPTCCGNEFASADKFNPGGFNRPFDLAYSNIPSLQMKVDITILPKFRHIAKPFENSTNSDHYPIIGTFKI